MAHEEAWVLATWAKRKEERRADWCAVMGLKNRILSPSAPRHLCSQVCTTPWLLLFCPLHSPGQDLSHCTFSSCPLKFTAGNGLLPLKSWYTQEHEEVHLPGPCSQLAPHCLRGQDFSPFLPDFLEESFYRVAQLCVLASWASVKGRFSKFPEDQARRRGTYIWAQEMDLSSKRSSRPWEALSVQLTRLSRRGVRAEQCDFWPAPDSFLLRPFHLGGSAVVSPPDCCHPNQLPSKGAGQFCMSKIHFHWAEIMIL